MSIAIVKETPCGLPELWISWSRLRTHEECKQRGHLQRTGHNNKLSDARNYFAGTVTDRVVRDWLRNDPDNNRGAMPDMVESFIDKSREETLAEGRTMQWRDKGDRARLKEECMKAVALIEPDLVKYVLPYSYEADYAFRARLQLPHPDGGHGIVVLNGYMDIMVTDDKGRKSVFDVKHTKDNGYWRKTEGQLTFYDLATLIQFGQPTLITALLQPLCTKTVMPFPITQDKRSQLLQRVVGMARDVWKGDVQPREDTKECGFCPVKHACPKFKATPDGAGKKWVSLL